MADEVLIFDATGSNFDGSDPGSPLQVGPGTSYNLLEHEYPAAPLNVLYASSIDTEGENPVTSRYGNRAIRVKLDMVDASGTLLAALAGKFAKLQREGGTLKRTLKNGDVRIYDVVAGDGWSPAYDFAYYLGDLTVVEMQLSARPFSRGPEQDLGDNVETTLPALIFQDSVPGDVEALGRLVTDNDEASLTMTSFLWGVQSRYYSSTAAAALYFEAEGSSMVGATAAVGPAGATGAGANKVASHLNVGTSGASAFWVGAGSQAVEHIGLFRVIARVWSDSTNTGIVSCRLTWYPYGSGSTVHATNDWVPVIDTLGGALEGEWVLVDLGEVRISRKRVGNQVWGATVDTKSTVATDDVYYDSVMLLPVAEGSGVASDTSLLGAGKSVQLDSVGVLYQRPGSEWPAPNKYEGSYLLVPPAGQEARTLRVIVIVAGNAAGAGVTRNSTIPDISARLYVTPRYLT